MDKKILAVIAVIIIIVAGVAVYVGVGGGNGNDDSSSNAHAMVLDGVEATEDNVLNGDYPIQRNLVLVTKGEPTGNVALFLDWITSSEGQAILAEEFVPLSEDQMNPVPEAPARDGKTTIALGGSTSLTETMTKLVEAYMEKYTYMTLTVGTGGSGAGETGADNGSLDIGMLSRDMGEEYEGNLAGRRHLRRRDHQLERGRRTRRDHPCRHPRVQLRNQGVLRQGHGRRRR